MVKTSEISPNDEELKTILENKAKSFVAKFKAPFIEIVDAVKQMPKFMWQLSSVYLFQWYALFVIGSL